MPHLVTPRSVSLSLLCCALAACGGGGGGGDGGGGTAATADLVVSITAPVSVLPGATVNYSISVQNTGAAPAATVITTFTAPPTLTSLTGGGGGTIAGNTITWPGVALAPGASLGFTASGIAPSIGPLDGRAQVSTTSTETLLNNNTMLTRVSLGFAALATLTGEANGDGFGFVADAVADLDGDGRPDFIVGAPTNDAGGVDAGRAYVYSGANASLLFTLTGPAAGAAIGGAVADAGDVDGDGKHDLVVGGRDVVQVYSGADGRLLRTLNEAAGSGFGAAVAGLGDLNGDGRADLLIGASLAGGVGAARVVDGATGATIRSHTPPQGTSFGYGVGALGDVTGDGIPDYAVGGGAGLGGRVFAYSGADGALLHTLSPTGNATQLGRYWIDSLGDLDGDGRPDYYATDISASPAATNVGRAYIVSGASGTVLYTLDGETGLDFFGIARHSGQDVDGDGRTDLFIASYLNDEGGSNAGKAYVFSGADGTLLRTLTNTTAGQALGYDAVQLGDADGDGHTDYLLTGDITASAPGTVIVVRGTPLP